MGRRVEILGRTFGCYVRSSHVALTDAKYGVPHSEPQPHISWRLAPPVITSALHKNGSENLVPSPRVPLAVFSSFIPYTEMVSAFWYDISRDLLLWCAGLDATDRDSRRSTGIYLVLFCICAYILLHRPSSRTNTILLVTAIILFTCSTVLTVLNLVLGTAEIDEMASIPYQKVQDTAFVIYAINNSVADGLVIYRCYVVWNNDWRVIVLPIMLLVTSTACRIWWISRQARAYLGATAQRRYIFSIAVLVESGMVYSATILAYLIMIQYPSLANTLGEPILQIVSQVMGIAPTLIIVRVGLGLSVENGQSTVKTGNTSITLRPQRHAILGTSIGSADPKENVSVRIEMNDGLGKTRSLDAAV
ncbi:hypothetical protein C8R45DRAFT_1171130 [Mycena sanguinolenta]|nr:hypothetical protein C8R45DRAFT_1171130 [Mycena sanguinolenta]